MSVKIVRDGKGREAVRIVTDSGVIGYIATGVSPELMAAMAAKLRRKLAKARRAAALLHPQKDRARHR